MNRRTKMARSRKCNRVRRKQLYACLSKLSSCLGKLADDFALGLINFIDAGKKMTSVCAQLALRDLLANPANHHDVVIH